MYLYVLSELFSLSISTVRRKQEMSGTFRQDGTSGTHWSDWKHTKAAFARRPEFTVFALRSQVGNSQYYNYSLSVNGKEEKHGDTYAADYLTDLIVSIETCSRSARNPHPTSSLKDIYVGKRDLSFCCSRLCTQKQMRLVTRY